MWTRELLKTNAKQALSGRYWPAFAVTLICALLGVGNMGGTSRGSTPDAQYYQHGGSYYSAHAGMFHYNGPMLMAALFVLLLGLALSLLIINVLAVGKSRFFMENRLGAAPVSSLFSTFHRDGYWNLVKIMFLKSLYIFLWSLLFIIPGIIKAYEYSMVNYIAAENPYLPAGRVFELSSQMTMGEKWEMFVLDLSFLGWLFLGALALGIGTFFVLPYYEATYAELYAALHAKAFAAGYTNESELSGFMRY